MPLLERILQLPAVWPGAVSVLLTHRCSDYSLWEGIGTSVDFSELMLRPFESAGINQLLHPPPAFGQVGYARG